MIIGNNKNLLGKSGFTLVETLTAVAVLSIGLIGGLTVITGNLKNISGNADRITAANLTAEGIEMARNVRDTNWLKENDWDEDIKGSGNEEFVKVFFGNQNTDRINPKPNSGATEEELLDDCINNGGGDKCEVYFYVSGSDKYYGDDFGNSEGGYAQGDFTGFYRLIHIIDLPGESIKANVTVRWSERGLNKYLTASEILYDWKQ